ncbi:hypothetical protein QYE76_017595 [Lolium multiflorum]|uniref:Uncharacterized protein n=1 Tax=Lolium multiflorum TaxID=4521 RepID=A0AAD8QFV8_LOLMU|nr:hypothetical protein QYE76_017595 [Lolium multiflorum]
MVKKKNLAAAASSTSGGAAAKASSNLPKGSAPMLLPSSGAAGAAKFGGRACTRRLSDLRGVISSLEAFASQFTSLEADKVRLQKEVNSSSLKLKDANKIAAAARQEVDSLKEELIKLKERLKEEEASRLPAR